MKTTSLATTLWLALALLLASTAPRAETETPESVYNRYLDALMQASSIEELYPFWTINHINEVREEIRRAGRIGRNPEEDLKSALKQMKARAAITDRGSLEKETTGGRSKLTYLASNKEKKEDYTIVVDMLFEDGSWKIIRERMLYRK